MRLWRRPAGIPLEGSAPGAAAAAEPGDILDNKRHSSYQTETMTGVDPGKRARSPSVWASTTFDALRIPPPFFLPRGRGAPRGRDVGLQDDSTYIGKQGFRTKTGIQLTIECSGTY